MQVLLLSMPDSFEHMPPVAIRMPNGALTSLAGNVDPHHSVAVADLILVQDRVRATVEALLDRHRARRRRPVGDDVPAPHGAAPHRPSSSAAARATIVVGGYDPSLAPEAYADPRTGVDFIVRGEGEHHVSRAAARDGECRDFGHIAGLSWRRDGGTVVNPDRPVAS